MRRLIILAFLLGGMELIQPLGDTGRGAEWLLALGFLILAAYSVGEIAAGLGLPKIVGYLFAGVVFGPGGILVITPSATAALAPVSSLAIALIAYLAGAELRWEEVKERGPAILRIMTAELGITFVLIAAVLMPLLGRLDSFSQAGTVEVLAFSLLFASVAIIHSPAVAMAVLSETRAAGRVARTTLGVVLLADVVVVLAFSGFLALARALVPPTGEETGAVGLLGIIWELGGAVLVGSALGGLVALYLRFVKQELFFFAIMIAMVGAALSNLLHVETLLMLLVAGFVSENVSVPEDGAALRHAMERSADPVFVVFFALAGTQIIPREFGGLLVLIVPIVLVRMFGIWWGTRIGARWAGVPEDGPLVWQGLVAQAGVGLGLAVLVSEAYPARGGDLAALFVAVIAVNQFMGPVFFRRALEKSGEIPSGADAPEPDDSPEDPKEPDLPGSYPDLPRLSTP